MARVHLVLFYYERKKLVWNALQSFLDSEYQDWFLTVIDDSEVNKMPLVIPGFEESKHQVVDTKDTTAQKQARGGSLFGKFANEAIRSGKGDIVVPVCDDDAIRHDALGPLVKFFDTHPHVMSAWTYNIPYNPRDEGLPKHRAATMDGLNRYSKWQGTGTIEASCNVDSSQVVFRASCLNHPDVYYPFPATADLDAFIFRQLNKYHGLTYEAGIALQYKAQFPNQLGGRRHTVPYSADAAHVE